MDSMSTTPQKLVDDGVQVLTRYLEDHRTDHLRQLAEIVVRLRGEHTLEDGRKDWAGRSPAYRQSMADLYTRARVPEAKLDTVQAALRYHVGNLLRERAKGEELAAVGLSTVAPKQRLATARLASQAQKRMSAPPQDVAKLAAYSQALVEHIDEDAIPELEPERAVAARIALEAVQSRAAQLLVRLADAVPPQRRKREPTLAGRHRRAIHA